jgi:hypothetical protein
MQRLWHHGFFCSELGLRFEFGIPWPFRSVDEVQTSEDGRGRVRFDIVASEVDAAA